MLLLLLSHFSCVRLCATPQTAGSSVLGSLQARTLEWVAISFFNAWKWKMKVKSLSHFWFFTTPWTSAYQAPPSMGVSRHEYWSEVPLPSLVVDAAAAAAAKLLQLCLTLCDPIDSSPLGSPVPGILQARILEWVAISFSNAWKWEVKVKSLSRVRLFATPVDCSLPGSSVHGIFQARVLEWGAIAFSSAV